MSRGLPAPGRDYILGVDIIRFLSAVGVAAFHLTWSNPAATWGFPVGWVGVQLFFVISGLVIANSAYHSNWRRFARGRVLRLYPAAWCTLLLSWLCIAVMGTHAFEHEGVFPAAEVSAGFPGRRGQVTFCGDSIERTSHYRK